MGDLMAPNDLDSDPRVKALTWKYLPQVKTCEEVLRGCCEGWAHSLGLKLGGGQENNVVVVIQKVCNATVLGR